MIGGNRAAALGVSLGAQHIRAIPPDVDPDAALAFTTRLTFGTGHVPECGTQAENPRVGAGGFVLDGFVERVGDPVPLTAPDSSVHPAATLTAEAVRSVVHASAGTFGTPLSVVVACPGYWPEGATAAVTAALGSLGVPRGVRLEGELLCAVTALGGAPDFPESGTLLVADAGATGTSLTVVEAVEPGRALAYLRLTDFGGNGLDHAVLRHVLADIGYDAAGAAGDPNATVAIGALRRRCRAAKEELSSAGSAIVGVDLPGLRTDVRVTRGDLEELAASGIALLRAGVRDVLERANRTVPDVAAVALVGGVGAAPMLVQLLSGELSAPVVVDRDPKTATARGAAELARRRLPATPVTRPPSTGARAGAGVIGPAAGAVAGAVLGAGAAAARGSGGRPRQSPSQPVPTQSPASQPLPSQSAASQPLAPQPPAAQPLASQPGQGYPQQSQPHAPRSGPMHTGPSQLPPQSEPVAGPSAQARPETARFTGVSQPGGPGSGAVPPVLAFDDNDGASGDRAGGRRKWLIIVAVILALLVSGGVAYAVTRGGSSSEAPATPSETSEAPTTAATTSTTPSTTTTTTTEPVYIPEEPWTEEWVPEPEPGPITDPSEESVEESGPSVDPGAGGGSDGGSDGGQQGAGQQGAGQQGAGQQGAGQQGAGQQGGGG